MKYFKYRNQNLAYRDQGTGEAIIIVHGTPTNSLEFDGVINELSKQFRCVAIDHLGFGKSDKPYDGDYSLQAHQQRLVALINYLGIQTFHLLTHDFGGVIGLPLVINTNYTVLSITILNSWLWPISETQPSAKVQRWFLTLGIFPFIYRYFNFSPRFLIPMAWGNKKTLTKEKHQQYIKAFPSLAEREGPIGFMKALFDFNNLNWQQQNVFEILKKRKVLIIWGCADKLITIENLKRWKQELPNAQIHELTNVGHFVADESPSDVVYLMQQNIKNLSNEKI